MPISIYSILPLISGLSVLWLGIFVFWKNKKNKVNLLFGIFSLCIAIWLIGSFFMLNSKTDDWIIFWDRVVYIGVIFIPVIGYHFSLLFTKSKYKKQLLRIGYALALMFLISNFTDYFVSGVFKYSWGHHTRAQVFHHIFLIFFSTYTFLFFYTISRFIKKVSGVSKVQAKYFLWSILILCLGIITFLPAYKIDIYPWVGYLAGLGTVGIIGYGIVRYRLLDIQITIKKSTLFSLVAIVVGTAYVLVAFLLSSLVFGGELTGIKHLIITGLIVGTIVTIGFRPLYSFLQEVTDKYFFKGTYNPQELIRNISSQLATTLEVKEISDILKENIERDIRLGGVSLMLIKRDGEYFTQREMPFKDGLVSDIISYLQKNKETLVLEELERYYQEHPWKYDKRYLAYRNLKKINKAVVLPVYVKSETEGEGTVSPFISPLSESGIKREDSFERRRTKRKIEKLAAFIFLGSKKSGDAFTVQDINTLEIIASQVGVALENALMYERAKHFSEILQKEVERQTKELREANIRLKQLDKAKSEFISIASHQLRTPLTAIKGLVSMALEGFWGPLNEEQKKHLKEVYNSGERLLKLIEDLLDVSRIESGRMEFEFQPVNLYNLTKEVAEELKPQAKKKGLYLEVVPPRKKLPNVKADSLKIRQVIQNLIDNSIKYTLRGGIRIRFKKERNKIIFSIADTGMGIPKDTISLLFEKFHRGKEAIRKHTEGTGLGLYLCARLIEAHNGKIWVESEGEGKGSTFYFSLPIAEKK